MKESKVIRIIGIDCPPELDARFRKWCQETHIPMLFAFKGMQKATFFERANLPSLEKSDFAKHGPATASYPGYLVVEEFAERAGAEAYLKSPEWAAMRQDVDTTWKDRKYDVKWLAEYDLLKTWDKTRPGWRNSTKPMCMLVVGINCPPDLEEKFDRWYNGTHIPMILKFKTIGKATRYKKATANPDYPEYLATYEFADRDAFAAYEASPELAVAMEETGNTWKDRKYDRQWRTQYEAIKTWEK